MWDWVGGKLRNFGGWAVSKNSCDGLSQADLILALGVPKSTYYRYLDEPEYPLGQPFGVQKAWVDAKQVESGAKAEAPRRLRREEEGPSVAEQIKLFELRTARAKALKAEAELSEVFQGVLVKGGEVYLARRIRGVLVRLKGSMELVCTGCRGPLAAAVERALLEIDQVETEALKEVADAAVAGEY
jgi:hypothetical protein